ncbi:hypothetical protein CEXT_390981 [Caerostris extrusa]|uniref:Uncharacterized protein n=1 Tax=Caerostris extrusa TaxID=172846 RepID=A0AAV4XXQ7_CAEEX|nr:hypothetical protein CEXT_390981 [Caerostris extrusa]
MIIFSSFESWRSKNASVVDFLNSASADSLSGAVVPPTEIPHGSIFNIALSSITMLITGPLSSSITHSLVRFIEIFRRGRSNSRRPHIGIRRCVFLNVQAKILKADGTAFTPNDLCGPYKTSIQSTLFHSESSQKNSTKDTAEAFDDLDLAFGFKTTFVKNGQSRLEYSIFRIENKHLMDWRKISEFQQLSSRYDTDFETQKHQPINHKPAC